MLLIIGTKQQPGWVLTQMWKHGTMTGFAFRSCSSPHLFLRDHLTLGESCDLGGAGKTGSKLLDLPRGWSCQEWGGASLCRPDSPSDSCWTRWRRGWAAGGHKTGFSWCGSRKPDAKTQVRVGTVSTALLWGLVGAGDPHPGHSALDSTSQEGHRWPSLSARGDVHARAWGFGVGMGKQAHLSLLPSNWPPCAGELPGSWRPHLQGPLVALRQPLPVSVFTALNGKHWYLPWPGAVAKMRSIRNVLQSMRCVTWEIYEWLILPCLGQECPAAPNSLFWEASARFLVCFSSLMGASSLHTELICSPCYSVQSTGPGRWSHLLKNDQRDYSKVIAPMIMS